MSGIVLLFHRDGQNARVEILERMLSTLSHRGPDGSDVAVTGPAGLAHQHFWTTPEEIGERQPVSNPSGDQLVAFDGRLDNREELLKELCPQGGEPTMSDARLVLLAYQRWQEDCFSRLLGPFAIAVYDPLARHVVCARDPLGDRTLFYCLGARYLALASEEQAVMAHPEVSSDLDERGLAHYFALQVAGDGSTLFRDVKELPAGHVLRVDPAGSRTWQYWRPLHQAEWERAGDEECAQWFRELLEQAVRCRLRTSGRPAVLMSGGLDSTSVAAVAASQLAGAGSEHRLRTVSWIFDELPSCDERPWIGAMIDELDLDPLVISGDRYWPLSPWGEWPANPNAPEANCFRALKQRAYRAAGEAGSRVLLTGVFADQMYSGWEEWLSDLVLDGRAGQAVRHLWAQLRYTGPRATVSAGSTRRLVARAFPRVLVRWRTRPRPPEWLLPWSARQLEPRSKPVSEPHGFRRWEQHGALLGPGAAQDGSGEIFNANLARIELRHPFRDRRLVEFMLSLPAYQLATAEDIKLVQRAGLKGLLPESVRLRNRYTDLTALHARGLLEREAERVREIVRRRDATWRRFVCPDWMEKVLRLRPETSRSRRESGWLAALWRCVSFEGWWPEASRNRASAPIELIGIS